MFAVSRMPGLCLIRFSSVSGRSDFVRLVTSFWKRPKSARPTWIRSFAVLWTPAAIDSSATMSPTPMATPAAVSAVRPGRRMRFFQISPSHVTRVCSRVGPRGRGLVALDDRRGEVEHELECVIHASDLVERQLPGLLTECARVDGTHHLAHH